MTLSIVVPFRGDGGQRDRVWGWCERFWRSRYPESELIVADSGEEPFNRGNSRNEGARKASGDTLYFSDADGVNEQAGAAAEMAQRDGTWVIAYSAPRGFVGLTEEASDRVLATDPAEPLSDPQEGDWYELCHSYAGAIACRTEDFWAAGGYDPAFTGWGYEDDAFRAAMDTMVGPHQRAPGIHLHLWHPHIESERFHQPRIVANRNLAQRYGAAEGSREAILKLVGERP